MVETTPINTVMLEIVYGIGFTTLAGNRTVNPIPLIFNTALETLV